MQWHVQTSHLSGSLCIPPSKSHTIRAFCIATCAEGCSTIRRPLLLGDGASALDAARGLGAAVHHKDDTVIIQGIGTDRARGTNRLYLGNSGTGIRMFTAVAALGERERYFDGDDSLRSRPMKPLFEALSQLGAQSTPESEGRDIPFCIRGPLKGGSARVNGLSSQYLSSILLVAPLLPEDTILSVYNLHERPYVDITLAWLDDMNITYTASSDKTSFTIPGRQRYSPFSRTIPADFSSATFGLAAAAATGSSLILTGLDFDDPQGDKQVFDIVANMGVSLCKTPEGVVVSGSTPLQGIDIDCNECPDALPALAVLGCIARGTTRIHNVGQARIKETDRIAVMAHELGAMGARTEELPDGLIVHSSPLHGAAVNGHHDHRVVMALALAGMAADGTTIIETAEAAEITYPGFVRDFQACGAAITEHDS